MLHASAVQQGGAREFGHTLTRIDVSPGMNEGRDSQMIRDACNETRIVSKECIPFRSFKRVRSR
jgi:hypothetical protein